MSIATSSLAAKALVEPMLNVNPRADLPSVNVQEVILVIPTPTVSEILVVLIHVVSIEYLQTIAILVGCLVPCCSLFVAILTLLE